MTEQERAKTLERIIERLNELDRPQLEQLNNLIDKLKAEYAEHKDGERE